MENYLFKILLGGCVGYKRTEIMNRFTTGQSRSGTRIIIGVDFAVHSLVLPEKEGVVTLQIWDFGEEKQFRSLVPLFSRGASGAILYFDLLELETLFKLEEWIFLLRSQLKNIPILLCGTNCHELADQAGYPKNSIDARIQDFMHKHHLNGYFGISVKTGCNISKSFEQLTLLMVQQWSSFSYDLPDRIAPSLSNQIH